MKFQQLLYVREVARSNLNVSQASKTLYTSQPGISKQIKLLEEELGIELFERSGKHLVSITPVGQKILEQIEEILALVDGINMLQLNFQMKIMELLQLQLLIPKLNLPYLML